jgi:outer membrane lipoprotein-sorting protein
MIGRNCPSLEELPSIPTMPNKWINMRISRSLAALLAALTLAFLRAHGQVPAPGGPTLGSGPGSNAAESRPSPEPAQPPTEAEQLIDEAIKKLASLQSVSADMLQHVEVLKQSFDIKGRYLKAPASRIYLRLSVSGLPDSSGTMLQVCDGETLWDYQQVLESQSYRKMSVKPVLERLGSPEIDAELREQIMVQMGFTGPEAILVGLRKAVKFDQKEEGDLDGKPVWILRGTWQNRNGLVGPDQRPLPPTGQLPPYVPSLANLYLGKDDGWPYRLVLLGRARTILQDTRRVGPDGRPIGSLSSIEKIEPTKIELVYSNVQLNPDIKIEEFAFQAPPNANVEDTTETILKGLDQAIQFQALQKRSEAAKQDVPVLDQSIDLPLPPNQPTPE